MRRFCVACDDKTPEIRDGKTVQSRTFHADSARRYKKNCIFAARRLILAGSWGMRIRHHSDPDRRKRLKLLAAVVGGGALVVMGALSINLQPDRGTTDREVQTVAEPMQTGETATTTTPPVAPETSVAVPPVKAPPYGGG
jgi:hypothetical protein